MAHPRHDDSEFRAIEQSNEKVPQHEYVIRLLLFYGFRASTNRLRPTSPHAMVASTPVRRSTRGMPLVAPSTAQYSHAKNSTYSWLEPLPPTVVADLNNDEDTPEKRYYRSFIRVSQKLSKGNKRATKHSDEPTIEQLRFNIGDGVLVACHGNSIGVGVLTKLWDELREVEHDESDEEEEEGPEHEWRKQCEIRWCYRRQDLPTTMNQMALLDVSIV